nr:serine/threonine-protein kinase [Bacteroides intestinalis]
MRLEENILFAKRYTLVRQIGQGGYSTVWLAKHTITNIEVVLKVYAPHTGLDQEGLEVFSEEFKLLFNLNHSNLLKPAYFDIENNNPYLVLPYCTAGSCKRLIGQITETEAWHFILDVTSGLDYLHSLEPPIVHQDIKPDNILIGNDGKFLITDFGISTRVRSTLRKSAPSSERSGAGTTSYMGPERFGKNPMPIKASDIWSLGATLYELLTGDVPFGETGGLIQKNGADIPSVNGYFSRELKQIVENCLLKEPWNRPTAEQLKEYASDFLKGNNPKMPWSRINEEKKKGDIIHFLKRHWVAVLTGVCCLTAGTLFYIFPDSKPQLPTSDKGKVALYIKLYTDEIRKADAITQNASASQTGVLDSIIQANHYLQRASDYIDTLSVLEYDIHRIKEKYDSVTYALENKSTPICKQWEEAADNQVEFSPEMARSWYGLLLQIKETPDIRTKYNALQ